MFKTKRDRPRTIQLIGLVTNGGRRHEIQAQLDVFNNAAEKLRKKYPHAVVFNPVDHQRKGGVWESYMADCLEFMFVDKPVVYRLPNWQESQGARLENLLAKQLGLEIRRYR